MKILLATDGSVDAEAAAELLQRLPLPPQIELTLLTVDKPFVPMFLDDVTLADADRHILTRMATTQEHDANARLSREAQRFATTGWTIHTAYRQGHVGRGIVDATSDVGCDLVVVGARGLGNVERFLLGSVSDTVVKHAPCAVLVAHVPSQDQSQARAEPGTPLRILLAYDGSAASLAAVEAISAWPVGERAEVTVVTVLPLVTTFRMDVLQRLSHLWQEQKQAAAAKLATAAETIRRATPHVSTQLHEAAEPAEAILQLAQELPAELIVLGDRGKSRIERFLLGSVTARVVRQAPCGVLVIRA